MLSTQYRLAPLAMLALIMCLTPRGQSDSVVEEPTAADTVALLQTTLADAAADHPDDYAARLKAVRPVALASHDFEAIAKVVMGSHWSQLDDDQRARFLESFTKMSVSTYAARFKSKDGARIRFKRVSDSAIRDNEKLRLVRTLIQRDNEPDVRLDYMLRNTSDGWRVINVVADGVSDLALKRAEYNSVMNKDGFDALVAKLDATIERHAAGLEE